LATFTKLQKHHGTNNKITRLGLALSFNDTLKLQSNGPFYSNTVIGSLAVDGWAVTFGTARRGLAPPSPLLAVPNVTAHPSTASVPTSYYAM